MPSLFFPRDVVDTGFAYGWCSPAYCVAGVIKSHSKTDAQDRLNAVRAEAIDQGIAAANDLVILGEVEHSSVGIRINSAPRPLHESIILYERHTRKSQRFYVMGPLQLDSVRINSESSRGDVLAKGPAKTSSHINETVLAQINVSLTLDEINRGVQPQAMRETTMRVLERVLAMSTSVFSRVFLPSFSSICDLPISSSLLLKDVSNTMQQLDIRAEQGAFLISNLFTLQKKLPVTVGTFAVRYINFFNAVWLILNDFTIGMAAATFLCENCHPLAHVLQNLIEGLLVDWVQWVLGWLDSWPAGLKLNTELSALYSQTFIQFVALWGGLLRYSFPYLPAVIYSFGLLSIGGFTVTISLFSDLLAVLTAHLYLCYVISDLIYAQILSISGSLWNIFRGKRYNALRNRTDIWEYDMDQLLFGTILFTLVAFLFPTILVYYALFAMMRLGVLVLHALMETLLASLNHFPLFSLMLRIKDPWRLPGGLYFVLDTSRSTDKQTCLLLKNQPIPFSSIFFQYVRLWSKLSAHYNPVRLLKNAVTGQFLSPISRYSIRYDKLTESVQSL